MTATQTTIRRGGVVRLSPEVLARLLDLPEGAVIVAAKEGGDYFTRTEGRPIEITVIGEGMPEYELGMLPPYVDIVYVKDDTKLGGGRLESVVQR